MMTQSMGARCMVPDCFGQLKHSDLNVSKFNRIVVAGETKMSFGSVFAGMRTLAHELCHSRQIAVENHGAIEFDFNFGTLHGHLLKIPFADGTLITAHGGYHAVGRTVRLAWIDLLSRGLLIIIIEHLQFAHSIVSSIAV